MSDEKVSYPLVVDLDGTLIKSDLLFESVFLLIRQRFFKVFFLPFWLLQGIAYMKLKIAEHVAVAPHLLPYNEQVLAYIRQEKESGREIVLATASVLSYAQSVADHLGLFDHVMGTTEDTNLKGSAKLAAIRSEFGDTFAYAGDSSADLAIWRSASSAVLVGISQKTRDQLPDALDVERDIPHASSPRDWVKALRVHQWIKNLLIFVPLFTSFLFSFENLVALFFAFFAFSFLASATYIVNDLTDLPSDRGHPTKKYRPFASGAIPIQKGLFVSGALIVTSFLLAAFVGPMFVLTLVVYLCMTLAYSWLLKRYVLMDVIMLSLLYTIRVLAGSAAIGVMTSEWLLAFSVFIFLSLALVKRCSELVMLAGEHRNSASGRDYHTQDLTVLWPFGVGSAMAAIVVFCQFISDPETQTRYETPFFLWLVAPALTYWLLRLWVKTARGEMHDDPIVYAIRDKGSLITIVATLSIVLLAYFV